MNTKVKIILSQLCLIGLLTFCVLSLSNFISLKLFQNQKSSISQITPHIVHLQHNQNELKDSRSITLMTASILRGP